MNPRPDIQEELIKPYKEMEDVYSLSCVVGDAMEREQGSEFRELLKYYFQGIEIVKIAE